MKKTFYYFALCMSLFSCSQENNEITKSTDQNTSASKDVTFTVADIPATTKANNTSFEIGDEIGVYVVKKKVGDSNILPLANGNNKNNVRFRYDGTKFLPVTDDDKILIYDGEELNYYAYFPYNPSLSDATAIPFKVASSQLATMKSSDFCTGKAVGNFSNKVVALQFSHKMAQIEISIPKQATYSVTKAILKNCLTSSIHSLGIGQNTASTASDIEMFKTETSDSYIFNAMIPVQKITQSSLLFSITINGIEKNIITTTPLDLIAGEKKVYSSGMTYQISVTTDGQGTINPSTGGSYVLGSTAIFKASSTASSIFNGWYELGSLISSDTSISFTVTKNRDLVAKFDAISYDNYILSTSPTMLSFSNKGESKNVGMVSTRDVLVNGRFLRNEKVDVSFSLSNSSDFTFDINTGSITTKPNATVNVKKCILTLTQKDSGKTCAVNLVQAKGNEIIIGG